MVFGTVCTVYKSLLEFTGGKIGDFLSSATQREFLAPQISMSGRIAEWTHVRHYSSRTFHLNPFVTQCLE